MTPITVSITADTHLHSDGAVLKWLHSNIGWGVVDDINAWQHENIKWSLWFNHYKRKIVVEFKNSEHAMLFAARWAG